MEGDRDRYLQTDPFYCCKQLYEYCSVEYKIKLNVPRLEQPNFSFKIDCPTSALMLMGSPRTHREHSKIGEYIPQTGEQGNTGTGNKKGEYTGNSCVFGKMKNFPAKSGNPVPREYAT